VIVNSSYRDTESVDTNSLFSYSPKGEELSEAIRFIRTKFN